MAAAKEKVVKWKGSLGIEQAESLKSELLEAFDKNKNVLLDLSKVEDVDTTTIQLILAAKKEAEKKGINFKVDKNIPNAAVEFLNLLNLSVADTQPEKTTEEE